MDKSQQVFLELVKSGLWETEVKLSSFGEIDYSAIYNLAEEQSVIGLVTAGLEHVTDVKVPQEWLLQFIGSTLQIEQQNKDMNGFVAELIGKLRSADIYAILIKGQGIAQCYENPLWRSSGDVDLLLSDKNYQSATALLSKVATTVDDESEYKRHLAMTIEGWTVELHGSLRSGLWKGLDQELDKVQGDLFYGGKIRSWQNGRTQVFLPAPDDDGVFVFSHILQHFFKEGIGLRQICDWCRLLLKYKMDLDTQLLELRLKQMGVVTEWKAFAALAVDYLGMPVEAMPFYSDSSRWKKKASRIMEFVLETGNFGHNRDYSYRQKHSYLVLKTISMWKHIQDFGRYFVIFPLNAIKVTWRRMILGFSVALRGKTHE